MLSLVFIGFVSHYEIISHFKVKIIMNLLVRTNLVLYVCSVERVEIITTTLSNKIVKHSIY